MEEKVPIRKSNRFKNHDYSSSGAYFITICTKDSAPLFWSNAVGEAISLPLKYALSDVGKTVEEAIKSISLHYSNITVNKYMIMPDHIHLILLVKSISDGRLLASPTISTVIGHFKRSVSVKLGASIWQRSFFDHVIRTKESYFKICKYIDENPWHLKERNIFSKD